MSIWFIIGAVFGIIGLGLLFVGSVTSSESGEKISLRPGAAILLIIALAFTLLSCFAVVGTRNVGVETVFGKPNGTNNGAGLVFKAPWVSVNDVDATIHPEEYKGDDCIYVKIADGGSACVSLAYRWRINPDGADSVYADYRNSDLDLDDAVKKALVSTNIKAAINEVLGGYDPLNGAELDPDMTPEQLANVKVNVVPDYEQMNKDIQENVEAKIAGVGDLINIESITVSYVSLPEATQDRINAFNQAVQNTRIALQEVATKNAQASANNVLAGSLKDPNVLVSKCLDGLISGDIQAPAGFQCFPGAGGSVVLPSAK